MIEVGDNGTRSAHLGQGAHDGGRERGFHSSPRSGAGLVGARQGIRSQRYAMVVDDGGVKTLYVEAPGKFEISGAASVLATLSQS